jgi:two-component system nitrate/nitrite response regulator NarL
LKDGGKVFPDELAEFIHMFIAIGYCQTSAVNWYNDEALSNREIDILQELGSGQSNKMIAVKLGIAEATVKVYVKRILRKIGVRNRTQAALWAAARGHVETLRESYQQPREPDQKAALVAHRRTAPRPTPKP